MQKVLRIARPQKLDCSHLSHEQQEDLSTTSKTPSDQASFTSISPFDETDHKIVVKSRKGGCFIGGPEDAPAHIVDTIYITHGYRCGYNSVGSVLKR